MTRILLLALPWLLIACGAPAVPADERPPNVLLLFVDDLRPELGCYGHPLVQSPNIDRLAGGGVLFERAYCNIPVCGASRASLLTGKRPTRQRFLSYDTYADKDLPGLACLPQHFKDHGYYSISNGKVFHHLDDRADAWHERWRPAVTTSWRDYQLPENIHLDTSGQTRGPAFEAANVPDSAYFDGRIARKTARDLQRLAAADQPFFLAAGFLKPHLPFNAPRQYWDRYPPELIRLPDNPMPPEGAPAAAIHNSGELRAYHDIPPQGPVSDAMAHDLIRGYYAAVSYVDAQVGLVLDELERLGLAGNTLVVLLGDHGWNLREHGLWCKHSNFRTSLRTTLIARGPGIAEGGQARGLVEFVDLYPTLCDLAGLPLPEHLDGASLRPQLADPATAGKDRIIAKWFDGLTIVTDRYAYTEWSKSDSASYVSMLYDHQTDLAENHNIADDPALQATIEALRQEMREHRGAEYSTEAGK